MSLKFNMDKPKSLRQKQLYEFAIAGNELKELIRCS